MMNLGPRLGPKCVKMVQLPYAHGLVQVLGGGRGALRTWGKKGWTWACAQCVGSTRRGGGESQAGQLEGPRCSGHRGSRRGPHPGL